MISEELYPGYNEMIKLRSYDEIKTVVNDKYGTKTSASQVRLEFESAYNKLFDCMMKDYSNRIFDVIFVLMDTFNIKNETRAIRYLNKRNRELVKNFAKSKFETAYYEKKEREKIVKKRLKRDQKMITITDIQRL